MCHKFLVELKLVIETYEMYKKGRRMTLRSRMQILQKARVGK
jgi:hypothetical protein